MLAKKSQHSLYSHASDFSPYKSFSLSLDFPRLFRLLMRQHAAAAGTQYRLVDDGMAHCERGKMRFFSPSLAVRRSDPIFPVQRSASVVFRPQSDSRQEDSVSQSDKFRHSVGAVAAIFAQVARNVARLGVCVCVSFGLRTHFSRDNKLVGSFLRKEFG